jgi:flavorubredoxin
MTPRARGIRAEADSRRDIDGVVTLVSDKLYLLGGVEPVNGDLSWLPRQHRGFESLNSYLLVDGNHAALIDPGVSVYSERVKQQVGSLAGAGRPISMVLTRSELDCLGALDTLLDDLAVDCVYAGSGPANPFDYFDDAAGDRDIRLERMDNGQTVDLHPGSKLVMVKAPIRVLATGWLFDGSTKTLFTSDSFGYLPAAGPQGPRTSEVEPGPGTASLAREYLMTKFDWLAGAHLGSTKSALIETFRGFDVERIAPTHGCVIVGPKAVQAHADLMVALLDELDAR